MTPEEPTAAAAADEALRVLGAHAEPLAGGYSGETFLVGAAGEQAVLRIYGRRPQRAEVDAALLDLVRGLVPVPRVLDLRTPRMGEGPPYLLTEHLPGVRLEQVLADADETRAAGVARAVADVLARLNGIPFRRAGDLVGPGLVVEPWPAFADGLVAWVDAHLGDGALARWSDADQRALRGIADHADAMLATTDRWCLAHSDFNAKNLLVDPDTCEVTGVLDWEFAHAGTPYTDLGNLLRFERRADFAEPLLARFVDRAPPQPSDLLDRARAADLWALVDLAARAGRHTVADRAHDLLRAVARRQDLHAAA
jgi:aminoglycoside phosphotransferase (APT) family kinase protein